MLAYILRRLLLMIPTILGIMAVSFAIVQFVKRDGSMMMLPNGKPLTIEFLDSLERAPAAYPAVHPEPGQARHSGELPHRRSGAIQEPDRRLRFRRGDHGVGRHVHARRRPPQRLYVASPPKQNASRNLAGVSDPVVDALVEAIATAKSRDELNTACPRARPRPARRPLLGPDVVSRHGLGRPLGRVFASRAASRGSASARPAPGGGTKRRPRPLDSDRRLPLRPRDRLTGMLAYILRRLLADDPDDPRHHGGLVRDRAIRAGRPGRARDRAIAGRGPELDRAIRRRRRPDRRGPRRPGATSPRAIAARRASIRNSSRSWRSNTASTSRRSSGSGFWCATIRPSISARAIIATCRCSS